MAPTLQMPVWAPSLAGASIAVPVLVSSKGRRFAFFCQFSSGTLTPGKLGTEKSEIDRDEIRFFCQWHRGSSGALGNVEIHPHSVTSSMNGQMSKQLDEQINGQTDGQMERQVDRQMTKRWTDRGSIHSRVFTWPVGLSQVFSGILPYTFPNSQDPTCLTPVDTLTSDSFRSLSPPF